MRLHYNDPRDKMDLETLYENGTNMPYYYKEICRDLRDTKATIDRGRGSPRTREFYEIFRARKPELENFMIARGIKFKMQ